MAKKITYTIGLDLGGTKLAAALLKSDGSIIDSVKVPVEMGREKSPKQTQKRVIELMAAIAVDFKNRFPKECGKSSFRGVGLASAGPLNTETGEIIHAANLPGWKLVPIRAWLEKEIHRQGFKTKVHFQNDAIAAALAEGWIGGAKNMQTYAMITVGTGIGCGVIFHGQPCHSRGMGSEFGHLIVDYKGLEKNPDKLNHFTVEGIASGTGLLRRAQEMGFTGSSVEELVNEKSEKYESLFKDMAWALACLCYDLSIGFNVEKIFVSGGLIKIKELYLPRTQKLYQSLIRQKNPAFESKIEIAKTKNQSGVLGAGYLPYL